LNQTAATSLPNILAAECAALQRFVALLEREQGMLVENRTDQLLELSGQKSSDALSLNKLAESRHTLLQHDIPQLTRAAIDDWLTKHHAKSLPVWHDIVSLTERARELNQINGQLIQSKLRHNQQALTVLSNAVNQSALYGADGQARFSPGSGRSLGSG